MEEFMTLDQMDHAANVIRCRTAHQPKIGLVLGTGLGDLAESVSEADIIPYKDIPHWPKSTVLGHAGRLVIGKLEGKSVIVMQGRVHYYEGYSMHQVTFPVRVMQRLGVGTLALTNAAGAVNPDFLPGDLMLLTDHIALIGMAGLNPLCGPNIDELGERFPDMSQVYDHKLIELARAEAKKNNITLREGIYTGLSGPSFEGPADLRFLRIIGTDAVGMSTVTEAIVARHGSMRVLGISGISNKANLDGTTITSHLEVLEAGKVLAPKLKTILLGVLRNL